MSDLHDPASHEEGGARHAAGEAAEHGLEALIHDVGHALGVHPATGGFFKGFSGPAAVAAIASTAYHAGSAIKNMVKGNWDAAGHEFGSMANAAMITLTGGLLGRAEAAIDAAAALNRAHGGSMPTVEEAQHEGFDAVGGFIGFDMWHPEAVPGYGAGPVPLDRPWDPHGPNVNTPEGPTHHDPPQAPNYSGPNGPTHVDGPPHSHESHGPAAPTEESSKPTNVGPDAGVPILDPELDSGDQAAHPGGLNGNDAPFLPPATMTSDKADEASQNPALATAAHDASAHEGGGAAHGGSSVAGMSGTEGQTVAVPVFNPSETVSGSGDHHGDAASDSSAAGNNQTASPATSTSTAGHVDTDSGSDHGGSGSASVGMSSETGQSVVVPVFSPDAPTSVDTSPDVSGGGISASTPSDAGVPDDGIGVTG